ncbi:hypothetical protein SCHPADRAFT_932372 [Schizopora paradoxa]|uniref:Uncharacterized protein n=1 Tax=Schizopora paradoxa TaxID=27342 RepID=A0A0H2R6T8_9AGAM|nr:hypothetical protein SCHPADRAFT_932372 [Schizopora paradoxa]
MRIHTSFDDKVPLTRRRKEKGARSIKLNRAEFEEVYEAHFHSNLRIKNVVKMEDLSPSNFCVAILAQPLNDMSSTNPGKERSRRSLVVIRRDENAPESLVGLRNFLLCHAQRRRAIEWTEPNASSYPQRDCDNQGLAIKTGIVLGYHCGVGYSILAKKLSSDIRVQVLSAVCNRINASCDEPITRHTSVNSTTMQCLLASLGPIQFSHQSTAQKMSASITYINSPFDFEITINHGNCFVPGLNEVYARSWVEFAKNVIVGALASYVKGTYAIKSVDRMEGSTAVYIRQPNSNNTPGLGYKLKCEILNGQPYYSVNQLPFYECD